MIIIIFYLLSVVNLVILIRRRDTKLDVNTFNKSSIEYLLFILLSIIISTAISNYAKLPEGSSLGGLIWFFGPLTLGGISILVYLLGLLLKPKIKKALGISIIVFNILAGVYFYAWPLS